MVYNVTPIKYPASSINDFETGIDTNGVIVGNGQSSNTQGYAINGTTVTPISYPGSIATQIDGISAGRIFGSYEASGTGGHGFVYSGGVYTSFDVPIGTNYFYIHPEAVNAAGTYVGSYSNFVGVGAAMQQHAFTVTNGVLTQFDAPGAFNTGFTGIDDSGRTVGNFSGWDGGSHGFILQPNGALTQFDVPGADNTSINGVTAGGVIFGYYSVGRVSHGFLYDGSLTFVDVPGAVSTYVEGVDSSGAIFGGYSTSLLGSPHGFVAVNGTYTSVDGPNAFTTDITGRDAAGQIVGSYRDGVGGSHGFEAEPLNAVYRFYNPKTGDHFFTMSAAEHDQIVAKLPDFQPEGIPWATPNKGATTTDVYRFVDTVTGDHFFTVSAGERDAVLRTLPNYQYEGVAFQAYTTETAAGAGALPLERFVNAQTGAHLFTGSASEIAAVRSGIAGAGWTDEGVGFIVHTPTADLLHA